MGIVEERFARLESKHLELYRLVEAHRKSTDAATAAATAAAEAAAVAAAAAAADVTASAASSASSSAAAEDAAAAAAAAAASAHGGGGGGDSGGIERLLLQVLMKAPKGGSGPSGAEGESAVAREAREAREAAMEIFEKQRADAAAQLAAAAERCEAMLAAQAKAHEEAIGRAIEEAERRAGEAARAVYETRAAEAAAAAEAMLSAQAKAHEEAMSEMGGRLRAAESLGGAVDRELKRLAHSLQSALQECPITARALYQQSQKHPPPALGGAGEGLAAEELRAEGVGEAARLLLGRLDEELGEGSRKRDELARMIQKEMGALP